MRSIKLLLVLAITSLTFSVGAKPPITAPVSTYNLAAQVQKIYISQIGVREATGKNDGAQVEKYLKSTGLGKGHAWCAAFVKWSFLQAGVKTNITAWSPTALNKNNVVYQNGRFYKQPQPADVFVLYFAQYKRIAHTGFFDYSVNNTVYSSVEGNTNGGGSRDGDGVYRRYRSFKATYAISRWIASVEEVKVIQLPNIKGVAAAA
jgi:hypothetical protein